MKKRALSLILAAVLVCALLPTAALAAAPALDGIAYPVGNRAACKMDAAMAQAYIKAIRQAKEEMKNYDPNEYHDITYDSRYDDLCVALVDLAGDGYPILITAVLEVIKNNEDEARVNARENWNVGDSGSLVVSTDWVTLWSYENGVAYDAEVPILWWDGGDYGDLGGQTAIHTGWSSLAIDGGGEENCRNQYYGVSQGKITMLHDVREYGYVKGWDVIPEDAQSDGTNEEYTLYYRVIDMGKNVTGEAMEYNSYGRRSPVWPKGYRSIDYLFSSVPYGYHECCIETTRADQAIAALQKIVDARTAFARSQRVEVDGALVSFPSYALKDDAGNETNYVKVRDFALILNQMTDEKFNVTWNADLGAVDIVRGEAYAPNGSELANPFSGDRIYETPEIVTLVDGEAVELDTFQLKDDNGGGYTYYKLRDLGNALGFKVDWSKDRGIFIETK